MVCKPRFWCRVPWREFVHVPHEYSPFEFDSTPVQAHHVDPFARPLAEHIKVGLDKGLLADRRSH